MAKLCRFDQLRLKTDRELLQVVHHALALGLREARHAIQFSGSWTEAEGYCRSAKRAYTEAARLIHLAGAVSEEERNQLAARLKHLWELLEAISDLDSTPAANHVPRALFRCAGAGGSGVGIPAKPNAVSEREAERHSGMNPNTLGA
jgi:hypothetical protein